MVQVIARQNGWIETTLGKVALNIAYGYTESATQEKIGSKFLRITDIQEDFIDWNSVPYCPISENDHQKYKLEIGDVVIARTGNSTGATATIKENVDAVFASYLIRFKIDPKKADFRFIDFLLRSNFWKGFVRSIKGGSAQGGANAKNFAEFPISLPPLPEQCAIAALLSSLDDKIELLREQNKTLEDTAQAVFREWFGKYQVGDELPKGWRVGKLGEIAEITSGKRPENSVNKLSATHQIPLVGATKIMGYVEDYLFNERILVIGRVGTHGEIQKFNKKIWASDNTLVIKSEYFVFVYQLLKSIDYEKMNRGAVQPLITQTDLKNYLVIIPSEETFGLFKKSTDPIFSKIENNSSQIQNLSTLRDELLPRLMRGDVRVKSY